MQERAPDTVSGTSYLWSPRDRPATTVGRSAWDKRLGRSPPLVLVPSTLAKKFQEKPDDSLTSYISYSCVTLLGGRECEFETLSSTVTGLVLADFRLLLGGDHENARRRQGAGTVACETALTSEMERFPSKDRVNSDLHSN